MTSRNPEYQKIYDAFVRENSTDFQQNITLYNDAKSLAHSLESYDIAKEFEEPGTLWEVEWSWGLVTYSHDCKYVFGSHDT